MPKETAVFKTSLPQPSRQLESWRHFDAPVLVMPEHPPTTRALDADAQAWLTAIQAEPGYHFVWVDGLWQPALSTPKAQWPVGLDMACWSTCQQDTAWLANHDARTESWRDHRDCTAWFDANRQYARGGAVLTVAPQYQATQPIFLIQLSTQDDLHFLRQSIQCGDNSRAHIVLAEYAMQDTKATQHATHFWQLGVDAHVRVETLMASEASEHLSHHYIDQARGSCFEGLTLQLSGRRVQTLCHSRLAGDDASIDYRVVACPGAAQQHHHALSTCHQAPQTSTHHEVKMLVGRQGRGICYSDVTMLSGVDGAKSQQTNRNLGVDASAAVFTQPRLVIHHDQVQCAHGATTGRLDANMIRYMQSRGIDRQTARAMLLSGFVETLVSQSQAPWLLAQATQLMAARWPKLLAATAQESQHA